ncbi:hypothetical protein CC1G_07928 [Coprinopsis cinerea okayama7|uniref:GST N-terminal domain-containing protein n=1 Tax=Coprinopsis cinerea (strain Okayama-7 / 130 / ATCC MYA-4618 / FGSC 9003) TaxID=240176 RepID=A8P6R8_COPC7|nr:hypothetical protein CC1G_07928 [Coprinopsis cinerea okayama7\|eukprot:XP_001839213.1 hypothetical protein CC1G_07928 [Coprinopsis cinerea okayama7\
MITLYDSPCTLPIKASSPNTWKARFVLNYKRLPYKTEWVAYHDIASVYTKHGLSAVCKRLDGEEFYYSLPVIYDSTTGKAIADSLQIAKYLDEQYPDTPRVFGASKANVDEGEGVRDEGVDVDVGVDEAILNKAEEFTNLTMSLFLPVFPLLFKQAYKHIEPASRPFFSSARLKDLAPFYSGPGLSSLDELKISEEQAIGAWKQLEVNLFKGLDARVQSPGNGKGEGEERLVGWCRGGDKPTFEDFVLGGMLIFVRIAYGEESAEWKGVSKWNEGKWGAFLDKLAPYQTVQ